MLTLATEVTFPVSAFVPLAVGFFGLGTGYLIYGPEELLKLPARNRPVDLTTGLWGIWMPGFMQFLTGVYLFVGLAWFHSFREKPLYMAALAFTAYGVHWWAIGMARALGGDPRPNGFMAVAFTLISVLGIIVFFHAHDEPVGGLFIGLTCIYVSDFFASLFRRTPRPLPAGEEPAEATPQPTPLGELGERALGFFHLGTGLWLMYLTFAVTLNTASGFDLPL
jgi:multisubunit Na+/H+ antiporter MnhB subunit